MEPGSRAPFPLPPREDTRGSVLRAEFAASCPRRLGSGMAILLFRGRLLLLTPPPELGVSPDDHLQGRVDDVVRRALDERRVLLNGHCNRLLQFVFALHHLGRFVNDRHKFFSSSFSLGRGQNTW